MFVSSVGTVLVVVDVGDMAKSEFWCAVCGFTGMSVSALELRVVVGSESDDAQRLKGGGERRVVYMACSAVTDVAKLASSSKSSRSSSSVISGMREAWSMEERGERSWEVMRQRELGETERV